MRDRRPEPGDYHEYYAGYIDGAPDGDIVRTLRAQFRDTTRLLESVTPAQELHRYAEGKWCVREVIGHLIDTEYMFMGRALWIAREPDADLPGMDQDLWVRSSGATRRTLMSLAAEWKAVREATIAVLEGLPEGAWDHRGRASGVEVTVRAIPWMIAGHERHHRDALERDYGLRRSTP